MRMRHISAVQHYASGVYIISALHSPLPYYDLFMAARSALSQPCLQLYSVHASTVRYVASYKMENTIGV